MRFMTSQCYRCALLALVCLFTTSVVQAGGNLASNPFADLNKAVTALDNAEDDIKSVNGQLGAQQRELASIEQAIGGNGDPDVIRDRLAKVMSAADSAETDLGDVELTLEQVTESLDKLAITAQAIRSKELAKGVKRAERTLNTRKSQLSASNDLVRFVRSEVNRLSGMMK